MKFNKYQKGIGFGGWLLMIVIFGGGLTTGLKLYPVYADHATMVGILEGVATEAGLASKRDRDINELLLKRFKINGIRDFDMSEVEIKRDARSTRLVLDYEVRMPMVHNLDLIASFSDEVTLRD